jgi:heme/copper-type cytochrome/quinol oxidase subunit 2
MRIFALLTAIAALLVVGVPAGTATTAPGYNFTIKLTIKKGGQLTWTSNQVKRGWLTHFRVTNRDNVAHRFTVGGLGSQTKIAPGKTIKLGGYSEQRGQFAFKVDGKTRGWFVVN